MFTITGNKGFHIKFANGWTISVQWGPGNYCENYRMGFVPHFSDVPPCRNAEVGIWDCNYKPGIEFEGRQMEVHGYQTPEEVAGWIAHVANRPQVKEKKHDVRSDL